MQVHIVISGDLRISIGHVPVQILATNRDKVRAGTVRVEVADRGGPGVPELRQADRDAEDGRGLGLVARLAARWGWRRRGGQMVTWFELSHTC